MSQAERMRHIIRRIPMFAQLPDEDCDALHRGLVPRQLMPEQVLFRRGEPGDSMIIVADGTLSVRTERPGPQAGPRDSGIKLEDSLTDLQVTLGEWEAPQGPRVPKVLDLSEVPDVMIR
jgi:hypothetical protein